MGPLMGIGAGLSALGSIGKFFTGIKQNKLANQINPVFDNSNLAKNQSLANNMFNGRMAGAGAMEQNIIHSGANFMGNVDRNAGSSASALALAAASQGQTNQALADLAVKEAQNKQQNAGLVMGANKDMNQSLMDKFSIDVQAKNALRNAAMMNKQGAVNDLGSMGMLMGQLQGMGGAGGSDAGAIQGYASSGLGMQKTIPTTRNFTMGNPLNYNLTGSPMFQGQSPGLVASDGYMPQNMANHPFMMALSGLFKNGFKG